MSSRKYRRHRRFRPLSVLLLVALATSGLYIAPAGAQTPTCASAASDSDGDGWGWENNASCRVNTSAPTPSPDEIVFLPPAQPIPSPYIPPNSDCISLARFQSGCEIEGGPWSQAFAEFVGGTLSRSSDNVGANVQFFPQSSQPLEEVMYVVGPYFGPADEDGGVANISDELAAVREMVPAMGSVEFRLRTLNASIVYIGFGSFEDVEQPTAQRVTAVKSTIRAFETLRHATLGHEPHATALMGLSLGGVAGKIALSELESEGFDHGVETYLSFDSPHGGAYTPPGLQVVPRFLEGAFGWGAGNFSFLEALTLGFWDNAFEASSDDARAATNLALRSPVAQELLIVNTAYPDNLAPNFDYIGSRYSDLPRDTVRNVAISSGSVTGNRPNLASEYFSFDTGDSTVFDLDFRLEMSAFVPSLGAQGTFDGRFSHKAFTSSGTFIPFPEFKTIEAASSGGNAGQFVIEKLERGACAHNTAIVTELTRTLSSELSGSPLWDDVAVRPTETRACFIPTFSSVIGDPQSDRPADSTRFDRVIGDSSNGQHLEVTRTMEIQILDEIQAVFGTNP